MPLPYGRPIRFAASVLCFVSVIMSVGCEQLKVRTVTTTDPWENEQTSTTVTTRSPNETGSSQWRSFGLSEREMEARAPQRKNRQRYEEQLRTEQEAHYEALVRSDELIGLTLHEAAAHLAWENEGPRRAYCVVGSLGCVPRIVPIEIDGTTVRGFARDPDARYIRPVELDPLASGSTEAEFAIDEIAIWIQVELSSGRIVAVEALEHPERWDRTKRRFEGLLQSGALIGMDLESVAAITTDDSPVMFIKEGFLVFCEIALDIDAVDSGPPLIALRVEAPRGRVTRAALISRRDLFLHWLVRDFEVVGNNIFVRPRSRTLSLQQLARFPSSSHELGPPRTGPTTRLRP